MFYWPVGCRSDVSYSELLLEKVTPKMLAVGEVEPLPDTPRIKSKVMGFKATAVGTFQNAAPSNDAQTKTSKI